MGLRPTTFSFLVDRLKHIVHYHMKNSTSTIIHAMLRCSATQPFLLAALFLPVAAAFRMDKTYPLQMSDFVRSRLNFNSSDVPLCCGGGKRSGWRTRGAQRFSSSRERRV